MRYPKVAWLDYDALCRAGARTAMPLDFPLKEVVGLGLTQDNLKASAKPQSSIAHALPQAQVSFSFWSIGGTPARTCMRA
jgi:hypothetical protein